MDCRERYDVVVVGGSQAACRAATASSHTGTKTLLLTSDLDMIARSACRQTGLGIKHLLEREPNLDLCQSIVVAVDVAQAKVRGVVTKFGERFDAKKVILGLQIGEPMSAELAENLKKVGLKMGSTTHTINEENILSAKKEIKGIRPKRDATHHYILPNQLKPNSETKRIAGLYFVGPVASLSAASKI